MIGNLAANPIYGDPSGVSVCSFRIAVAAAIRKLAGRPGEDFLPIVA
jgi:hypothetical protein